MKRKHENRHIERLLRLIFPPKCIFCGQILENNCELEICDNCNKEIKYSSKNIFKASQNIVCHENSVCRGVVSIFSYSGIVKKEITRYKFNNKPQYFRTFGKLLGNILLEKKEYIDCDIVIPVPMYKKRKTERGYNQSELIAKKVSQILRIDYKNNILIKAKDTKPQSSLGKEEKATNNIDAFTIIHKNKNYGKKILLIDDIITTGATIENCAMELIKAGAKEVIAAVLATGRKV